MTTTTETIDCCARPPLWRYLLGPVARRLTARFRAHRRHRFAAARAGARNASHDARTIAQAIAQETAADDRRTAQALGGVGVLPR